MTVFPNYDFLVLNGYDKKFVVNFRPKKRKRKRLKTVFTLDLFLIFQFLSQNHSNLLKLFTLDLFLIFQFLFQNHGFKKRIKAKTKKEKNAFSKQFLSLSQNFQFCSNFSHGFPKNSNFAQIFKTWQINIPLTSRQVRLCLQYYTFYQQDVGEI